MSCATRENQKLNRDSLKAARAFPLNDWRERMFREAHRRIVASKEARERREKDALPKLRIG